MGGTRAAQGDVCGQQCFRLPPLLSIPMLAGRAASSANAGPCTVRARFAMASSASLRYAGTAVQDVKRTKARRGERAGGHTYLANGADRPVTNPEGFAAQEFGRRDNPTTDKAKHQCSTVHSVAFLPSSQLQLVIENTDSKQKNR